MSRWVFATCVRYICHFHQESLTFPKCPLRVMSHEAWASMSHEPTCPRRVTTLNTLELACESWDMTHEPWVMSLHVRLESWLYTSAQRVVAPMWKSHVPLSGKWGARLTHACHESRPTPDDPSESCPTLHPRKSCPSLRDMTHDVHEWEMTHKGEEWDMTLQGQTWHMTRDLHEWVVPLIHVKEGHDSFTLTPTLDPRESCP